MSLPDYRSPGKQSTPNFHTSTTVQRTVLCCYTPRHSAVLQCALLYRALQCCTMLYSTSLTLLYHIALRTCRVTVRVAPVCKSRRACGFLRSRLREAVNGLRADADGRFFLDRDGRHFGPILEFLRTGRLPTEHVREVYAEAVFYGIAPLVKQLEDSPQLFGETVARRQFLARVPNYAENLELIVRIARAEAMAARHSSVVVCVLRTEEDVSRYKDAVNSLDAAKESAVRFGPWKAAPTVSDLLDCIKMDIEAKGYRISFKPHSAEKGFSFKSYDFFYKIIFTWW
ncbi:BTB/POZ domain-containing protein KCTD14-like [Scleropages formosus]|uniref:BTB/POZ domain-containing protein KCTD14-like n=1 Tax=Scleropages formosus TaxID=113540 RepID=A0A0P7Y9R5_SCLFO|nr:BTB/POZ domain-containing protein KCTD14-like [Scleropages formosus]